MTKPKNRLPAIAIEPGEPTSSSSASVAAGSVGFSGSALSNNEMFATLAASGPYGAVVDRLQITNGAERSVFE